jgi:hypothetical protein
VDFCFRRYIPTCSEAHSAFSSEKQGTFPIGELPEYVPASDERYNAWVIIFTPSVLHDNG